MVNISIIILAFQSYFPSFLRRKKKYIFHPIHYNHIFFYPVIFSTVYLFIISWVADLLTFAFYFSQFTHSQETAKVNKPIS